MRGIEPGSVIADFTVAIAEAQTTVNDLDASNIHRFDTEHLFELLMMSIAVLWEGFISDLFVAYITRNSTKYRTSLKAKVEQSLESKFGPGVARRSRLNLPTRLDSREVAQLLDPNSRNLTFRSARDVIRGATELLHPNHAKPFREWNDAEIATIDALKALRNYIAHRSRAAKLDLDKALADKALPGCFRMSRRKVASVGDYLAAKWGSGASRQRRIMIYLEELGIIAGYT